jgi:hypothetical protein
MNDLQTRKPSTEAQETVSRRNGAKSSGRAYIGFAGITRPHRTLELMNRTNHGATAHTTKHSPSFSEPSAAVRLKTTCPNTAPTSTEVYFTETNLRNNYAQSIESTE